MIVFDIHNSIDGASILNYMPGFEKQAAQACLSIAQDPQTTVGEPLGLTPAGALKILQMFGFVQTVNG